MKSRIVAGIVAGLTILVGTHVAEASQGAWTEYAGGGPSGHVDGDGAGGIFSGTAASAANGHVHAISQVDYLYRWDGSAWSEYYTAYNDVNDVFSPIGGDQYSVLFINGSNVIYGYRTCGFFCNINYTSYSEGGFQGISVAGSGSNPYAAGATRCGTYDWCIYHYSSGTWTQMGTQGGQMVTVDVSDSNHYPWTVTSSGTIYKWNGSSWVNANAPSGITPNVIAVSNGSVWAISTGSAYVYEWEFGTSSWVNHSGDSGSPNGNIYPASISVAPSNTGPYVPWVYVVTSGNAPSYQDPETLWFWACTNCTDAPSP